MDALAQSTLDALLVYEGEPRSRSYENALRQACRLEAPLLGSPGFVKQYVCAISNAGQRRKVFERYLETAINIAKACLQLAAATDLTVIQDRSSLRLHAEDEFRHANSASILFKGMLPNGLAASLTSRSEPWVDFCEKHVSHVVAQDRTDELKLKQLVGAHMDKIVGRMELLILRNSLLAHCPDSLKSRVTEGMELLNADCIRRVSFTGNLIEHALVAGHGNQVRLAMANHLRHLNRLYRGQV
jgi:hypothetical protein